MIALVRRAIHYNLATQRSTERMRLQGDYIGESFAGEDLAGAELSGTFIDVDFSNADLSGAELNGTFINVNFCGADLTDADLAKGSFVS